jgi:hypothetical protein
MILNTMTIPILTTTQKVRVTHIYSCPGGKFWLKNELILGSVCRHCLNKVEDVTWTREAQEWLKWTGLPSIERKKL